MADTHQVFNQSTPLVDINLYQADPSLREAVTALAGGDSAAHDTLGAMGARYGSAEAQHWAVQANVNKPVLRTHDRFGHRIDEVEFHPAYHQLMGMAMQDGLHASPWTDPRPGAHVARAARTYLQTQVEAGHGCPITMTSAAIPSLRTTPALAAQWEPKITARTYDPRNVPDAQKPAVAAATVGATVTRICSPLPT